MSIWHVGHTSSPVSIENAVEVLQKIYGKDHIHYKETSGKSSGQWTVNNKPVGSPIILGEMYEVAIDNEGWYQLSYVYDNDTEEQTSTCIQTQNHVPDTPIIKLLQHFGGEYRFSDCSDECITITQEEV